MQGFLALFQCCSSSSEVEGPTSPPVPSLIMTRSHVSQTQLHAPWPPGPIPLNASPFGMAHIQQANLLSSRSRSHLGSPHSPSSGSPCSRYMPSKQSAPLEQTPPASPRPHIPISQLGSAVSAPLHLHLSDDEVDSVVSGWPMPLGPSNCNTGSTETCPPTPCRSQAPAAPGGWHCGEQSIKALLRNERNMGMQEEGKIY